MAPAFQSWSLQVHSLYSYQKSGCKMAPGSPPHQDGQKIIGSVAQGKLPALLHSLLLGNCFHQGEISAWLRNREQEGFSWPPLDSQAERASGEGSFGEPGPVRSIAGLLFASNQMFILLKECETQVHRCGPQGPSKELAPPLPCHSLLHTSPYLSLETFKCSPQGSPL